MKTEVVKLEHISTHTKSTYGGSTTIVNYVLHTICGNLKNEYEIIAEIRGIATADLHLNIISCIPLTNNECTLIESVIEELLKW